MKKILCMAAALAIAFTALCGTALAEPDGYPAVRIDPSTGSAWDLGGKTVYLYDYWTSDNWADDSEGLSERQQATYDYRTWIQDTYNCTVVTGNDGDWGSLHENLLQFAENPDGSLRVYTVRSDTASTLIANNALADLSKSKTVNLADGKWNSAVTRFMSVSGKVLGTAVGASEPRQVLFFNKRVLTEAGIDWNDVYDMQKNGTWTFSALEALLKKIHRDTDEDGEADVFGIIGSDTDLYRIAVFSNGGSFFDVNANGKLAVSVASDKTVEALNWAKGIWNQYSYVRQEQDTSWDYYKDAWNRGVCGFYIAQAYSGFNNNSEMSGMADSWGCVAFPKGPQGTRYVTIVSNNITVIPNVYDQATLSKITLIYDLWTDSTPGYFSGDEWIGNKYDLTDERAVNETYAMLRNPENNVVDLVEMIGSVNDVEASGLLWGLSEEEDIAQRTEAAQGAWQEIVDGYNASLSGDDPFAGYSILAIPADVTRIEEEAFAGIDAQVVFVPAGCESIGSHAFANNPQLKYVVLNGPTQIAPDAFEGSEPELIQK